MKRWTTFFVLVLLICSILVVSVSANGAHNATAVYSSGNPVDLYFSYQNQSNGVVYDYIVPEINKYVQSTDGGNPTYAGTIDWDATTFRNYYNPRLGESTAYNPWDVQTVFNGLARISNWTSYSPVIAKDYTDLVDNYGVTLGIHSPRSVVADNNGVWQTYVYAQNITIRYQYVVWSSHANEGTPRLSTVTLTKDVTYNISSPYDDAWRYFPLYTSEVFNADFFDEYGIVTEEGERYACILTAACGIISASPVQDSYYTDAVSVTKTVSGDRSYNKLLTTMKEREGYLFDADSIVIDYDNISFVSWIKNAVGGFMDFELVPGLSLAGILGILLGIPLLLWFLRMFAGG